MIKQKNNKAMAVSQVIILLVAILAFAFIVGSSIETVSADISSPCKDKGGTCLNVTKDTCKGTWKNISDENGIFRCPGDNDIQCCVPNEEPEKEKEIVINNDGDDETLTNNDGDDETLTEDEAREELKDAGIDGEGVEQILRLAGLGKDLFSKEQVKKLIKKSSKDSTTGKGIEQVGKVPFKESAFYQYLFVGPESGSYSFMGGAGVVLIAIASAAAGVAIFYYSAKALGAGERNLRNILAGGTVAGGTAAAVISTMVIVTAASAGWALLALPVAILWTAYWTYLTYQDYSQEVFIYSVQPWKAPFGGKNCEKCNDYEFGCSEYQCKSIAAGCVLINEGTDHESCAWAHQELNRPTISALNSSLGKNMIYENKTNILPPDRGVKIIYPDDSEGCLPAFTPVTLGVEISEVAECKIDSERKFDYEDMLDYMGTTGSLFLTEHEFTIPPTLTASTEAMNNLGITFDQGRDYDFFVKCKDYNGGESLGSFAFEFCVQEGPDNQAPIIEGTNFFPTSKTTSEGYISYINLNQPLWVYTNEPADCKWDHQDLSYDQMANVMGDCSHNITDYFQFPYYGCSDTISGINPNEEKNYYIKCEDKPWWQPGDEGSRISNTQPHILTLIGSDPLIIDSITVEGKGNGSIIYDSTNNIKVDLAVKTSAGADEGKARCQYSLDNNTFYGFYNKGSMDYLIENNQELWLNGAKYTYYVKCADRASNLAYGEINFEVVQDLFPPQIVRLYNEDGKLKLVTDEQSECVYSLFGCNYAFQDGTLIYTENNYDHYVDWDTEEDLYIKCMDNFGNKPLPQKFCSVVARAYE
ncbi:MAG: hypothetical protein U9Q99_02210 [Nanoarchaeota archaeon]|nr:hypothetical protein [Nanoarchaeota archaeon]